MSVLRLEMLLVMGDCAMRQNRPFAWVDLETRKVLMFWLLISTES
jgi:hypothetical protein